MKTIRMILGYLLGGLLVVGLIPYAIAKAVAAIDRIFRIPVLPDPKANTIVSILFLSIGIFFAVWSLLIQNIIGKGGPLGVANIEISPKTQNLVVTGPYRLTRNPMLFGAFMVYAAMAVRLNSLTAVILVLVFFLFMLSVVVRLEEKRLLNDFGSQYEEYRKKVSLFIPWFPKS